MVFGKTTAQKNAEKQIELLKEYRKVKKTFAILPMELQDGRKVWLQWVYWGNKIYWNKTDRRFEEISGLHWDPLLFLSKQEVEEFIAQHTPKGVWAFERMLDIIAVMADLKSGARMYCKDSHSDATLCSFCEWWKTMLNGEPLDSEGKRTFRFGDTFFEMRETHCGIEEKTKLKEVRLVEPSFNATNIG